MGKFQEQMKTDLLLKGYSPPTLKVTYKLKSIPIKLRLPLRQISSSL